MMWNEFIDGIVVDTSKFRMLCHTIYGKKYGSCTAMIDAMVLVREWKKIELGGKRM